MHYRLATDADLPMLAAHRWEFREEAGEPARESRAEFGARFVSFMSAGLATGQWVYWLAETDDGELVSHVAVCIVRGVPRPTRAADQWGYLTDVFTRAGYRRRGIGTALLTKVSDWAVAQDLELLLAWPATDAAPWYSRAGFVEASEVRVLPLRDFDGPPARGTGTG